MDGWQQAPGPPAHLALQEMPHIQLQPLFSLSLMASSVSKPVGPTYRSQGWQGSLLCSWPVCWEGQPATLTLRPHCRTGLPVLGSRLLSWGWKFQDACNNSTQAHSWTPQCPSPRHH